MKKRPFAIAIVVFFVIFVFFAGIILIMSSSRGSGQKFALSDKVGVIEVLGTITDSKAIVDQLIDFGQNHAVKAIVLRVDSPGGGVGPSQEIYDEVVRLTALKPVVVSMGSVAASGGYYISAPANRIFANPGTITGSIGVIMEFTNVIALMDKVGLKTNVIKSGDHKDIGSSVRAMTDQEKALLQSLIDDVHDQFVTAVSEGRHLEKDQVFKLADGRIFTGRQAQQQGLVDELGGLQAAIHYAGELAGIEGTPDVLYPAEPKPDLIDYFISRTASEIERVMLKTDTQGLQLLWSQRQTY
ncbi:signal peptide peptidase SppA [Desulfuromonas acetoxidans]|uniref:signal peptide peptidase SppA n=1 Tax=Desulfuromonas acetoxidans TaxID=891 RepID=UPI002931924E|nr:signal peptide peptidase SppA [Desulfuromonas acetoxidans]